MLDLFTADFLQLQNDDLYEAIAEFARVSTNESIATTSSCKGITHCSVASATQLVWDEFRDKYPQDFGRAEGFDLCCDYFVPRSYYPKSVSLRRNYIGWAASLTLLGVSLVSTINAARLFGVTCVFVHQVLSSATSSTVVSPGTLVRHIARRG